MEEVEGYSFFTSSAAASPLDGVRQPMMMWYGFVERQRDLTISRPRPVLPPVTRTISLDMAWTWICAIREMAGRIHVKPLLD